MSTHCRDGTTLRTRQRGAAFVARCLVGSKNERELGESAALDLPSTGHGTRKVEMHDSPFFSVVRLFFRLNVLLYTEYLVATPSCVCTRPLMVLSVRALPAP